MEQESTNGKIVGLNFFAWFLVRQHFLVQVSIRIAIIPQVLQMLLPPITPSENIKAGQHIMSNRTAFYVEYVSIPLCRSAFGYRSYLKCFNVTTANYPPRKTSSRSAFNVEQVSILCRIREHSIVQVSIRIPIISLCRSAFDHTSSVSMLLPPITLLGKHLAGQHLTSNRSAFHIPHRQRFAVQMQRSIRSLSLSSLLLSLSH